MLMESLSGSRHSFAHLREKITGPVDLYRYDPLGLCIIITCDFHFK